VIVPEQKVTVGAWFNAMVHGGESVPVSVGPNGVCTCRHSDAQVSRGSE
jgi:hypothetical protein